MSSPVWATVAAVSIEEGRRERWHFVASEWAEVGGNLKRGWTTGVLMLIISWYIYTLSPEYCLNSGLNTRSCCKLADVMCFFITYKTSTRVFFCSLAPWKPLAWQDCMVQKMDCSFSGLTSFWYPLKCSLLPAKSHEKAPQRTKTTVPALWATVLPCQCLCTWACWSFPPFNTDHQWYLVSLIAHLQVHICQWMLTCWASGLMSLTTELRAPLYSGFWWVPPQVKQGNEC